MTGKELDKFIIKCRREDNKPAAKEAIGEYNRECNEVRNTIYDFLWKHIRGTKMYREYKKTHDNSLFETIEEYLWFLSEHLKLWDLLSKIKYDEFLDTINTDKSIHIKFFDKGLFSDSGKVVVVVM